MCKKNHQFWNICLSCQNPRWPWTLEQKINWGQNGPWNDTFGSNCHTQFHLVYWYPRKPCWKCSVHHRKNPSWNTPALTAWQTPSLPNKRLGFQSSRHRYRPQKLWSWILFWRNWVLKKKCNTQFLRFSEQVGQREFRKFYKPCFQSLSLIVGIGILLQHTLWIRQVSSRNFECFAIKVIQVLYNK